MSQKYMFKKNFDKEEYKRVQKERADKVLTEIFEKFKTEEFPNFVAKEYLKGIDRPSDKWSLSNRFAMFIGNTEDARGYQQWMKIKRNVKKGSKAIYILAPNQYYITKKVIDSKTKEEKEEKIPLIYFKPIPVFRAEDTEGNEPIKYVEEPKEPLPLKEVFDKFGLSVTYAKSEIGEYGSYNGKTKEIKVCTPNITTAFHELVHHVHSTIEPLKAGQDREQEIIAQLTALILAKIYNFETKDDLAYTHFYIKHYSEEKGASKQALVRNCLKVIGKIEKILDKIFECENNSNKGKEEESIK